MMTKEEKDEEILSLARLVLSGQSASHVDAARVFAGFLVQRLEEAARDRAHAQALLRNLTSVQTRATELLEEMRALKRQVAELEKRP